MKLVTICRPVNSSTSVICKVRSSEFSRSYANLQALVSAMRVAACRWVMNATGDSDCTCCTCNRSLTYSSTVRRNMTKCFARRMLPGTASAKISWLST